MPYMVMKHKIDPKKDILDRIGNLDDMEIFNNEILVGVYIRPEKTKSGIILTNQTRSEDRFQSKVGIILKKGPLAFVDDSKTWFENAKFEVGDWIVFKPSDSWSITVNDVLCRILDDTAIRCRINHPDMVW
jgi:co-chaperonin GroES (HSP10)